MIACNAGAGRLVVVTCQLRCGDGVFRNDTSAFSDLGSPTLDHFHVEMQQKHRREVQAEVLHTPQVTRWDCVRSANYISFSLLASCLLSLENVQLYICSAVCKLQPHDPRLGTGSSVRRFAGRAPVLVTLPQARGARVSRSLQSTSP
jgi:hypothetical protein